MKKVKKIICMALSLWMGIYSHSQAAFTSVQKETFFAEAVVEGPPVPIGDPVVIQHVPLQAISAITRLAIVQGEVGANPVPVPNFNDRRTPETPPFVGDNVVRVTMAYRIFTPEGVESPTTTLGPIDGPDPFGFAFQIDPSSIPASGGFIKYQMKAERLQIIGGNQVITTSSTLPVDAIFDPESFILVGVQAGAPNAIGAAGGRFKVFDGNPNDGDLQVDVPAGAFDAENDVVLAQLPMDSPLIPRGGNVGQLVAAYQMNTSQPFKGTVKVNLLYPDFEFPIGQDGLIDGFNAPERNAMLAWWDGFVWRKLGGTVNPLSNTITARVGNYNFLAVVLAAPFTPSERRPLEKIITPNGDNRNDTAIFTFSDLTENVIVEIFDVTGRRIRSLSTTGAGNPAWDGRDDSGSIVESGIYIYQYNVQGERVSGMIAVAK